MKFVGARASTPHIAGTVYRVSIQQGVSMERRSEMEGEARKSDGVVISVSVGGATNLREGRNQRATVRALESPMIVVGVNSAARRVEINQDG